jgi:hypothetical protein
VLIISHLVDSAVCLRVFVGPIVRCQVRLIAIDVVVCMVT